MKRGGPLPRYTPLRARSKKREREMRERRALVERLLEAFPICQRCQARPSRDLHEIKKRSRGGNMLDPQDIAVLCRPCHEWTEDRPAEALAEGWLRSSWDVA